MNPYIPVAVLLILGVVLGIAFSWLSFFTGPKRFSKVKFEPYECGVPAVGGPAERMSVKFYLTAIMFILFDIETVFLYLWARVFTSLGWFGIGEVVVFVFVLLAGYIYVLRRGALEWE